MGKVAHIQAQRERKRDRGRGDASLDQFNMIRTVEATIQGNMSSPGFVGYSAHDRRELSLYYQSTRGALIESNDTWYPPEGGQKKTAR